MADFYTPERFKNLTFEKLQEYSKYFENEDSLKKSGLTVEELSWLSREVLDLSLSLKLLDLKHHLVDEGEKSNIQSTYIQMILELLKTNMLLRRENNMLRGRLSEEDWL